MLRLLGSAGKDLCDKSLSITRRDVLRVGGSGLFGLSLANLLKLQSLHAATSEGSPGWNKAKRMILVYLQGGPSHLDLWDPKENVPDKVKSVFKPIPTKIPGTFYTENLPKLAQVNDKFTMIRSMGYTPNGLFKTNRERPEGWWEGDLGKIYRPKYFRGGIAIHGMTSVPNHPASHGCVRLSLPAMDFIWDNNLVPLRTPVWVHE
jgi:hypothetical protein